LIFVIFWSVKSGLPRKMKLLAISFILICGATTLASARSRDQTVASGRPIVVARYYTWNGDCSGRTGVATVLRKPRHGTISKGFVSWKIGESRRKGGTDRCFGRPIDALAVTYKSQPGFHGGDSFSVEIAYPGYRDTDTFTMNVQ
jgi:hypothetical protein